MIYISQNTNNFITYITPKYQVCGGSVARPACTFTVPCRKNPNSKESLIPSRIRAFQNTVQEIPQCSFELCDQLSCSQERRGNIDKGNYPFLTLWADHQFSFLLSYLTLTCDIGEAGGIKVYTSFL